MDLYDPADVFGIGPMPMTAPTCHDTRGRFIRTMDQAEIDAEAARLRSRGLSYRQIAETMGCDIHTAHDRVRRALAAVPSEAVDELRKVERARYDEMLQIALSVVESVPPLVSQGKVIRNAAGQPEIDWDVRLRAMDRVLKISEARRRLEGMDAPIQVEQRHTHEVVSVLDAEIRELIEREQSGDTESAGT